MPHLPSIFSWFVCFILVALKPVQALLKAIKSLNLSPVFNAGLSLILTPKHVVLALVYIRDSDVFQK